MLNKSLKNEIISYIPQLRSFAISLSGSVDKGDDLVQDTLLRAMDKIALYQEGTNLKAWLFTILRNIFYSDYRKKSREVQDTEGFYASSMTAPTTQEVHVDLQNVMHAMTKLSDDQREALTLICMNGMSYEEAAEVCNCQIGTMKSRVNRARSALACMLGDICSTSYVGFLPNGNQTMFEARA